MRHVGASAVEMALITPLLLMFALAGADFGRVIHAYLALSSAVQSGAAFGGTHAVTSHNQAVWEAQIRQSMIDDLTGLKGFDPQRLQVSISNGMDGDGLTRTAIEATYPFEMAIPWPHLPSQVLLRQRAEMRRIH